MHFKKIKTAVIIASVIMTSCFSTPMVYAEEMPENQNTESGSGDGASDQGDLKENGDAEQGSDQEEAENGEKDFNKSNDQKNAAEENISESEGEKVEAEEAAEDEEKHPAQGGEGAPYGMKINLLSQPYGVSKEQLSFSWMDAAVNGVQMQSAYRIVVSAREKDASAYQHVYDTDWVEDTRNTSVLYDLSEYLEDNELYYWQVQIRNTQGEESPLSEAQPFTTAVGEEWTGTASLWGKSSQKVVMLRTEAGRPANVERAVISVTATSSEKTSQYIYNLYVNGTEVGAGPTRANDTSLYYNTYDLTEFLQEGKNVIGLVNYAESDAGVLCQLTYYYADGTKQVVNNSGRDSSSWKVLGADNVYIGTDTASIGTSFYTAKKDNINMNNYPEGWQNVGYDPKGWSTPNRQNNLTNYTLEPSETDNMKRYEVQPVAVTDMGNGTYLIDMGKEIVGSLKLDVNGNKETLILEYGEELKEDGSVKYQLNTGNKYQEKWTLKAGEQSVSGIGMKTFRYVMIRGCKSALSADRVRGLQLRQPFDDEASYFRSANGVLNDVYELSKYTSKVTNQDVYVDTQNRERRAYEGDALIAAMTSYSYSEASTLAGYSAKYLLTHTAWPAEYSLYNIMLVYQNYMYTGDKRELESNYQKLKEKTLEQYYDANIGLMEDVTDSDVSGQKIMVDWPTTERDGYKMTEAYYNTVFNAVCVGGYGDMAKIADVLGYTEEAEHYRGLAASIRSNMITKLYNADSGTFYDGLDARGRVVDHSAQHATVFSLAFGVYTDQAMADQIVAAIEGDGELQVSIYGVYFLLQGLYESNHGDLARKIMSNPETMPGVRGWAYLLYRLGVTVTPEAWNSSLKPNMSFSHVWGSAPGSMLVRGMFGIRPTSPGFETFQVKLQPGGVSEGAVKIPTMKGLIEASYTLGANGQIDGSITVPGNSTGELCVPSDTADGVIYIDGTPAETVFEEGYLKATVLPGTHSFSARTSAAADASEWTKTDVVYSTYADQWSEEVTNGFESGEISTGKIEGIKIRLRNQKVSGTIEYDAYMQSVGWLDWTSENTESGMPGEGKRLEAYKVRLTGELAEQYDVYYRSYVQGIGWLDWAENGETSGTLGYAKELYIIQVKLVKKGEDAPGDRGIPYKAKDKMLSYATHVQSYGWQAACGDGEVSGTVGSAKRLEALKISLADTDLAGGITYCAHVQTYGWQGWKSNGQIAGTSGQAKRLEAVKIKLTGEIAEQYDVYYRVHVQTFGWLDWAKNGEEAGSEGYGKRLEAIQIKLVKKGNTAPGATSDAFRKAKLSYRVHVQSYGWQDYKYDGGTAGTSGQAKRLEALQIRNMVTDLTGDIEYRSHVQTYGWEKDWKKNGQISGTSGQAKRLEAVQIRLTGELEETYDIYYRVHSQTYGWLGWAKNGEEAGTEGQAKRLEAIEIVLVEKGDRAPGSTKNAFIKSEEE